MMKRIFVGKWPLVLIALLALSHAVRAQFDEETAAVADSTETDSTAWEPLEYEMNVSAKNELYDAQGIDERRPRRTTLLDIVGSASNNKLNIAWDAHFSTEDLDAQQAVDNMRISAEWYGLGRIAVGDLVPKFSEYSLNGMTVRGGETQVTMGLFHLHLVGGITQRAAEGDTFYAIDGAFRRYLAAGKLLIGKPDGVEAGVAVTKVKDDVRSIEMPGNTRPQESLIGTFLFSANLKDQFRWTNEVNIAAHTRDIRSEEYKEPISILKGPVFRSLLSSRVTYSLYSAVDVRTRNLSLLGQYRRVQPGYLSLGTVRTDNDYQEISLDGKYSLSQRLLSARTFVSWRTDNLDGGKYSTSTLIRALQTGFLNLSRSLSMSFSYALFLSRDDNIMPVPEEDTLTYARNGLTQSVSFSPSFMFGSLYFYNRLFALVALNIMRNGDGADTRMNYDNYNMQLTYACNVGNNFGASLSNQHVRMLQSFAAQTINTTELVLEPSFFRQMFRTRLRTAFSYSERREEISRHWELGIGLDYFLAMRERLSLQLRQTWHDPSRETGFTEFRWWLNYIHDIL